MINGPHCPKCGFSNCWVWYSGEDLNNPDALRCEAGTGIPGCQCGYVYWRRNAPASEPTSKEAAIAAREEIERSNKGQLALWAIKDRRDRVRALVLRMVGRNDIYFHTDKADMLRITRELFEMALDLDERIESIKTVTNIQGSDS